MDISDQSRIYESMNSGISESLKKNKINAQITSSEAVYRVHIVYENTIKSRNSVYDTLDDLYGVGGWFIKQSGPMTNDVSKGLLVAEIRL